MANSTEDNSNANEWKDLHGVDFSLQFRGYTQTRNVGVPHNTVATTIVFHVVDAKVVNDPNNVHKSRKITTTVVTPSTVVDNFLNSAWDELKRFAPSYTITKTRQANTTLTASGFLKLNQDVIEHNPANWFSDLIEVPSWQTLTRVEVDDELGMPMTIVESVIAHSTGAFTNTLTTFYERRQVDAERDILTTRSIASEFSRTSTESIQFTWPGIFLGYTGEATFIAAQGRTYFQFLPEIRSPFTELTQVGVLENLVTAAQLSTLLASTPSGLGNSTTMAELFKVRPRDIQYDGILFNIHIPNVLTDHYEGTELTPIGDWPAIVATTNSADSFWGDEVVADTAIIQPSEPTALEYLDMIGDAVCIQDNIKPWKYGLYWRQRVTCEIQ